MKRVANEGPWSFDNHLLILGRIKPGETLKEIPLLHIHFWVQIHVLPMGFMSLSVGKLLGDYIGEFVEYDARNNSTFWKTYMWIKMKVNVRLPLKKKKKIRKKDGEWKTVKFQWLRDEGSTMQVVTGVKDGVNQGEIVGSSNQGRVNSNAAMTSGLKSVVDGPLVSVGGFKFGPEPNSENGDRLEIPEEKKRKKVEEGVEQSEKSMYVDADKLYADSVVSIETFLTARPGSQACRVP
ncbi:hypothetical protein PTKIN_Ptkin03bG0103300 [Pterospermum kingtungense]